MLKHGMCPHCHSDTIIPNVPIIDRGHRNDTNLPLTVGMFRNPEAWLDKDLFQSPLRVWVCGGCGYSELFVQDPKELLHIYQHTKKQ